jgi:hypothetical protein
LANYNYTDGHLGRKAGPVVQTNIRQAGLKTLGHACGEEGKVKLHRQTFKLGEYTIPAYDQYITEAGKHKYTDR